MDFMRCENTRPAETDRAFLDLTAPRFCGLIFNQQLRARAQFPQRRNRLHRSRRHMRRRRSHHRCSQQRTPIDTLAAHSRRQNIPGHAAPNLRSVNHICICATKIGSKWHSFWSLFSRALNARFKSSRNTAKSLGPHQAKSKYSLCSHVVTSVILPTCPFDSASQRAISKFLIPR